MRCRYSDFIALLQTLADVGLVTLGLEIQLGETVIKRFPFWRADADSNRVS